MTVLQIEALDRNAIQGADKAQTRATPAHTNAGSASGVGVG